MLSKTRTDWTIPTLKASQYAKVGYKTTIKYNLAFLSLLKSAVYHKKREKTTRFT